MRANENTVNETGRAAGNEPGRTAGGAPTSPTSPASLAVLAVLAVLAAAGIIGCGQGLGGPASIIDRHSLVIGVDGDQPGLGMKRPDGEIEGFDVDVASYVAGRLGVNNDRITFRPIPKPDRETVVRTGAVDLLLATYSITPGRKHDDTLAGPYYVAHQSILVRDDGAGRGGDPIRDARDLGHKRLCHVPGSFSWDRVTVELGIDVVDVPAGSYRECVAMLAAGRLDAVATDDLILAGLAARTGHVKLLNESIGDERYGIGLRKGDRRGCEAINRALTEMYLSGAAATMLEKWFGSAGLEVNTFVPQFEGCA